MILLAIYLTGFVVSFVFLLDDRDVRKEFPAGPITGASILWFIFIIYVSANIISEIYHERKDAKSKETQ